MGMRDECPFAMTSVRKRTSTSGRIIFLRLASMRAMEFRQLGKSGLKVPVLSFGTGTFGGGTEFFKAWGASDVAEATRLVDVCLEAGVNLFDTADIYSNGLSETVLGKAVAGRREKVLISTKASFRMGDGPNDLGSSRHHLIQACEASLRRLGTDYIDIYHLHGFDALAKETGKSVPQVALNWLLQRPTVATVIIGARNEQQLRQNLDAVGWNLSAEQMAKLDQASDVTPIYPYWHQRQFVERNPWAAAPKAPV